MNLLTFIDLALKIEPSKKSKSSSQKDVAFRAAIGAYLESGDCDIRTVILPDFLFGFGAFLAKDYRGQSPATCREILRTFRKYIRLAINEGVLPNIDVMPSVISRLDAEVWPQADGEDAPKTLSTARQDLSVKTAVDRLMKRLDAWNMKRKMSAPDPSQSKKERADALQTRCAAIYLFCILTYGIEVKEALAIMRDDAATHGDESVFIERYGMRLPVSKAAMRLVELYNNGDLGAGHLFSTLDNKKYKGDLDNAAKIIESHIKRFLGNEGLPLFRKQSAFIDWLNYAIECGLGDCDAETLWRHNLGKASSSDAIPALQQAQAKINGKHLTIDESWYLLSVISPSVKRGNVTDLLAASGILGRESEARKRIYAPQEVLLNKERGETAVLTRYIFFRGTPLQAAFANNFTPYAYVLRDRTDGRFARIHEQELKSLQVMLRDFPDAVELIDGQKWLEEHNAEIVEGCRAIIRSGNLIGKEAKVVRIKGKNSGNPTYFIEYVQGAIRFQTNLEGIRLDLVKDV